jgi:hypothetical protein
MSSDASPPTNLKIEFKSLEKKVKEKGCGIRSTPLTS